MSKNKTHNKPLEEITEDVQVEETTEEVQEFSLSDLYDDDVVIEQSDSKVNTELNLDSSDLAKARDYMNKARKECMRKFGKKITYVTTIPSGKDDNGKQKRKTITKTGYFIVIDKDSTDDIPVKHHEMRDCYLASTFSTDLALKFKEVIEVDND